jgi:hypothetical protein
VNVRNQQETVMLKTHWAKAALVLGLVGCAIATGGDYKGQLPRAAWDGKFVALSPEASKELANAFGGRLPKAILGVDNEGKIVVYQPSGGELAPLAPERFPVPVGDLLEPPLNITLIGTQHSPGKYHICIPLAGGGIWCF